MPRENTREMVAPSSFLLDSGLPANVDAEKTILGAILLDSQALSEAEERLVADDFSLDSHRRIYMRMQELGNEGRAVDLVTLANELSKYKEVEAVGGVAYLASLTEGLPRRPVIEEYIRIVKDKSLLRQLMLICSAAIARAADQSETALEVLNSAESGLLAVGEKGINKGLASLEEIVAGSFGSIDNLYSQAR
ncbi:MAG TPA: DnaB-like helicase N-terminal domain-containing protein, partial [Acidobacteriaceae bacterium]|nr:DnaB-like helicase N-terminal domain-containing protein [Acidobacteriaceae bacterium]